jgi:NAD+ diphosphatase
VEGGEFGEARASAGAMSGWEAGLFAQGRALVDWNVRNKVSAFLRFPVAIEIN